MKRIEPADVALMGQLMALAWDGVVSLLKVLALLLAWKIFLS